MAQTKNNRANPFTGAVNWTAISAESHTVELQTDKNLYGFYLTETPQEGSVVITDVTTGAATGAGLTVISSGTPGSGQARPDTVSGFVWCNSADNGKSLEVDYNGGGYSTSQSNLEDIAQGIVDASGGASYPPGHLYSLDVTSNGSDADHDLDIATGSARDSADAVNLDLSSGLTKQLDSSWTAGNNAGGLSSSLAAANNTWYYVHLIVVSGSEDVGFDTSSSAANLVADHSATAYREIARFKTDGSANIIPESIHRSGVDGDWQSYTPGASQGFGTLSSVELSYRWRSDGQIEIRGSFTCGTVTASEAQIAIPGQIALSSLITSSVDVVGEVYRGAQSPDNILVLATSGDTYLNFSYANSGSGGLVPGTASSIFGSSERVTFGHGSLISVEGP